MEGSIPAAEQAAGPSHQIPPILHKRCELVEIRLANQDAVALREDYQLADIRVRGKETGQVLVLRVEISLSRPA